MNIYVDADACPVTDIIAKSARRFNIPVTLVSSFAHFSHKEDPPGVKSIYVDTGAEAADYRIMSLVKKDDLLITQDYGLASLALAKGSIVLHHKGFQYTHENIDNLLDTRYLSAMARKSGERTKGPKPFSKEDQDNFRSLLEQFLF